MVSERTAATVELTPLRLFSIAFVLSFSLLMTNCAAYQWLSFYLEQQQDEPARDDGSEAPRLAVLGIPS